MDESCKRCQGLKLIQQQDGGWQNCPCVTESCPNCGGSKIIPQPNGLYRQCDCLIDNMRTMYLREHAIITAPNLAESVLTKWLYVRRPILIEVSSQSGMDLTVLHPHLKAALTHGWNESFRQWSPLSWRMISGSELQNIKYDKLKGHEEKAKLLLIPEILIIKALAIPTNRAFFKELELLLTERTQEGHATWLVTSSADRLKGSEYETTPQWTQRFNFMNKTKVCLTSSSVLSQMIQCGSFNIRIGPANGIERTDRMDNTVGLPGINEVVELRLARIGTF